MLRRLFIFGMVLLLAAGAAGGWNVWSQRRALAHFHAALAAVDAGDVESFGRNVQALEGRSGFENHLLLLHGIYLTQSGQHREALAQLYRVDASGELRVPTLLWRGQCLFHLERLAEAAQVFQQLVAENPDLPDAHRGLVTVFHNLGAADFTLAALKEVARLQPYDYATYRLLGLVYQADYANNQQAIENYRKALDCTPPTQERQAILREMAQCLIDQRAYTEALKSLEDLPEDAHVLTLRGECYLSFGDRERAKQLLETARRQAPEGGPVLLLEAKILAESGDHDSAIASYTKILEREPHDYQTRYQLALLYQRLGDQTKAEVEITKMKHSQQLRDRLTTLYTEAMSHPSDVKVRLKIAGVCDELGMHKLARTWKRAAEIARDLSELTPP